MIAALDPPPISPLAVYAKADDVPAEHRALLRAGMDPTAFSRTECRLVAALADKRGVVPYADLIRAGWGREPEAQIDGDRKVLRTNLNRMRPKLAAQGWRIVTRCTVGWLLVRGGD